MFLHGEPAIRNPDALQQDSKTPLKLLYEHWPDCGEPEYHTERIPTAPANDPLQWRCSLKCPAIVRPNTGELLLKECSFQAVGRGRHDAEQHCAQLALTHIAKEAPLLGVKEQ